MARIRHWRPSFSARFAAVLAVLGILIAAIPITLAADESRTAALQRATDKAGIASALLDSQRRGMEQYAASLGQQVARAQAVAGAVTVTDVLVRDSQSTDTRDVIGVVGTGGVQAFRAGRPLPAGDPLSALLGAAAARAPGLTRGLTDEPWMVASGVADSATAFLARPVDRAFMSSTERVTAGSETAALMVTHAGRVVVTGPAGAGLVSPGTGVGAPPAGAPTVTSLAGGPVALAATDLGSGYTLLVASPVSGVVTTVLTAALAPLAMIVAAVLLLALLVQRELTRPLRRLDRAVGAMSRGDLAAAVPRLGDGEIGRLAATFEGMRQELAATIEASSARAEIATQLNAQQPLTTSLLHVCQQLRQTLAAHGALIVVRGSEAGEAFTIQDGFDDDGLPGPLELLDGDGPVGVALHADGPVYVTATESTPEGVAGMRDMCAAPLRLGQHVLGVVAVAVQGEVRLIDLNLIANAAEQIPLALERYRFLALIQHQASTDELTGLHNYRFLVDHLQQQVELAKRLGTPLAVLLLDIDHFKRLNDTHGHHAGDVALRSFAQTVERTVRRSDLAARYGGEEFVVVMPNTGRADAQLVAEKVREAVASLRVPLEGHAPLRVTVSIGCAAYPEDTPNAAGLLNLADAALYRAKGSGRNRVAMAEDLELTASRAPVDLVAGGGREDDHGGRDRSAE